MNDMRHDMHDTRRVMNDMRRDTHDTRRVMNDMGHDTHVTPNANVPHGTDAEHSGLIDAVGLRNVKVEQ